jgi:hypothetical protein
MTPVRMMTHVPLVRIDAPRVEIGGGALVALPFADYDDMVLGSFTDGRRDYESTAPVFFASEYEVEVPDGALEGMTDGPQLVSTEHDGFNMKLSFLFERWEAHHADCDRVRDALALAAPGSSIPDPRLSLGILDIASSNRHTQTRQGQADQELLFLGAQETFLLSDDALAQASVLLDVVDRCGGELRQAIDVLHDAADLSLTANEQLTLCAIELEALLLPELTTELKQTFARRLGHLLGGSDTEAMARAVYATRCTATPPPMPPRAVPRRSWRAPSSRSRRSPATAPRSRRSGSGSTPVRSGARRRSPRARRPRRRGSCTRRRAAGPRRRPTSG